jgi:hypothetical protein
VQMRCHLGPVQAVPRQSPSGRKPPSLDRCVGHGLSRALSRSTRLAGDGRESSDRLSQSPPAEVTSPSIQGGLSDIQTIESFRWEVRELPDGRFEAVALAKG